MVRVKRAKNKKTNVWTNKRFVDNQDGSMPTKPNPLTSETKKPQPKEKSKSEQEVKTYQELKLNQGPNVDSKFQGPNVEGSKSLQEPNETDPKVAKKEPNGSKVSEISVFELCRTLAGLKAMEEATTNNNEPSPANEPYFASNLEYYPHLPQLLYSQQYQTFADLKVSVCHGNLTQMKPPKNQDYSFIQEWRDGFQTEEQRQAHIRNQRALYDQRIIREQRQDLKPMSLGSSSFHERFGYAQPPTMVNSFSKDWQKTCEDLGLQRVNFPWINNKMRFEIRHQELEGQENFDACQQAEMKKMEEQDFAARQQAKLKKEEQDFTARQLAKMKREELEALCQEKELIHAQMRNERARAAQRKKLEEHAARRHEQMEVSTPVANEEDDYEARQQADMKEEELEAIRKEKQVLQARLRNERAHTAQRIGREYKKMQLQRQYEFRFGSKDMAQGDAN